MLYMTSEAVATREAKILLAAVKENVGSVTIGWVVDSWFFSCCDTQQIGVLFQTIL